MSKVINIANLPNPGYYSPSELKHFLPFHQPSFSDNMFSIIKNYSKQNPQNNILLIPDFNLGVSGQSLSNVYYEEIKVVESEDFDGKPEHLKNSLEDASKIVNYLHSFAHEIRKEEEKLNMTVRRDLWKAQSTNVTEELNVVPKKHQFPVIGYNFMKKSSSHFTYIGWNSTSFKNLPALLAIFRVQNIRRLGLSTYLSELQVERMNKVMEHLFVSGRNFLRQVPDDYNAHHDFLASVGQRLSGKETLQNFQQILKEEEKNQPGLFRNLLTKCYKFRAIYKNKIQQKETWSLISNAVSIFLQQIPSNANCSYASHLQHDSSTNSINFLFLFSYAEVQEAKEANFQQGMKKMGSFMKVYQAQVEKNQPQLNKADDIFRRSMVILSKFQNSSPQRETDQSFVRPYQKGNKSFSRKMDQSFVKPYQRGNKSFTQSQISYGSESDRSEKTLSMQRIMKLENNFYELLKKLEKNQPVLKPDDLRKNVKDHLNYLEKKYHNHPGFANQNENQHKMMVSLSKVIYESQPQEIFNLIDRHPEEAECILQTFMQSENYLKILKVGKRLGQEKLQKLYKKSIDNGLKHERHCLLIFFLKKMLLSYQDQFKWQSIEMNEITIPELVEMTEEKKYKSNLYLALIKGILPQLFQSENSNPLKYISPLIHIYHSYLIKKDHHHELVNTFIGEILFQICYFTEDLKVNFLTNNPYLQENKHISLKEKKIFQMVRQGGFAGFGYEIRSLVLPLVQDYSTYMGQKHLYKIVRIQKSLHVHRFIKILSTYYESQRMQQIAKFYMRKQQLVSSIKGNKKYLCFVLDDEIKQFSFDIENTLDEQEDIEQTIQFSESRIFQELAKTNPKAKIAGIQLNKFFEPNLYLKPLQNSKKTWKPIEKTEGMEKIVGNKEQYYGLVKVAESLKEKYLRYHILEQNEKSYFRDCVSSLLESKEEILQYLQTCTLAKELPK